MVEKRDVVRRLRIGHTIRAINKALGMHRTIIRAVKALAEEHGWLNSNEPLPSEEAILQALKERDTSSSSKTAMLLDPIREKLSLWVNEERLSFVVIHRRLTEQGYELSETTVRRYIQKHIQEKKPHYTMLREHEPGKVMDVDFGYLGKLYDNQAQRERKAYVFSARLRFSRRAYREIVFSQKAPVFFDCHVHAFQYFGGVPAEVVPDNLKAAVIQASYDDIYANKAYMRLAEFYGFVINPCKPYHPEHKGGVESDIKYITENFWKDFLSRQHELGVETPDLQTAQRALEQWADTVAHTRIIGGTGCSVAALWQEEEQALAPLPSSTWHEISWHTAKVQETWRIQYNKAYYTVPYKYIGEVVKIMDDGCTIVLFHGGIEIARHTKATRLWATVEQATHAPPAAEAILASTRERILALAKIIGPATTIATAALLDRKIVSGLRPARALLALRKTYGNQALEEACNFALVYDSIEYRTIKQVLKEHRSEPVLPLFTFAREPGFFAQGGEA
jgi:transposase